MPRTELVVLTLCLLALNAARAELEVSVVSPVTAAIGSDAVLECTYTVDSPRVNLQYLGVFWHFKGKSVLGYLGELRVSNPRASLNESELPNGKASLLLSNVTASDERSYMCAVTYSPRQKQKTVTLNIQDKNIEVTASPASVAVKPGEDVTLNCILTVEQPPIDMKKLMVQWFHRGKQIAEYDNKITIDRPEVSLSEDALKKGHLSLFIAKAKVDHSGNYSCYVYYQSGVWMKEIVLTVEDPNQEEHVCKPNASDIRETLRWVKLVKAAVDELQDTVNLVKTDVDLVKTDVNLVKTDVDLMKTDVDLMKIDLNLVKTDVNLVKTDVEKCATRPHDKAP